MEDEVLIALREQLECYVQLRKLAKTQHECIQDSRNEELLEVLGQRQGLLEQMARLEKVILPAKRNWLEFAEKLTTELRSEAEELVAETRRLLEEIAAADRDDTLVLQQRKFNAGKAIGQAVGARKFNASYAQAAYGGKGKERLDIQR
jgi:hypothetical protein